MTDKRRCRVWLWCCLAGILLWMAVPVCTQAKEIVNLVVANAPLEISYGSTLETSQVSLTVQYSDAEPETVNPDAVSSLDTKKTGEQTLTFTYGGYSVDYKITVVPRQVTGITMKEGTASSMKVVWDKLEEAADYEIYTAAKENGKYTFLTSTTENEYTFQKLTQGELLYIKIRAVSSTVTGEDSEVKIIAAKPEKATGLEVTGAESTAMHLKWETAAGATGYAVYYKLSSKKAYTYAGSTESLTYKVTGLTANKEYNFIVRSFAADISNQGDESDSAVYGTAPAVPVISELKGGDTRLKIYWKSAKGAEEYRIYVSTKMDSGFSLAGTVKSDGVRIYPLDNLKQNQIYYMKIESSRDYKGDTLTATSAVLFAATKKAGATSTAAKFYTTRAKFKKSTAYKEYKAFRKQTIYNRSYVLPGMKKTNVGGFNSTKMVPQSIAFAEDYLLLSAYDSAGEQESVIYVMSQSTRRYITTIVLPHKGHVGGIVYDGKNIWIAYGKNLQCLKFSVIEEAVKSQKAYTEVYSFTVQIAMPDTVSYVSYYKEKIWAGTYSETASKYMYAFSIGNKNGIPSLTQTNKMMMPNRTQGVTFTADGKMIVSRSCQTKKGKSGFLCRLDVYKPTWNFNKTSLKKNAKKKTVQMPPMNEGIAVNGIYTYLVFESPAFSECPAPVDRVIAFKTSRLVK